MNRISQGFVAALFAAFLGLFGTQTASAAGMPAGSAITLEQSTRPAATEVYHRHWHRPPPRYRHHRYHRPHYYRPAPVYHRRCYLQPRTVWTPYGYVRRMVRVCRY
ncbi:MAG: hypothetical protein LCH38_13045 [Proteobacteria bacterium]|nr:hypothetical protein [Pseudomonadota bacterium]